MSDQFIGEIRMFGGNFAISGWALCNGQLLGIAQNTALFSLIGTTYGGDGQQTFALPNLQGRLPLHQGTGPGLSPRSMGEMAGTETVTLTLNQIPSHTHGALASTDQGSLNGPGPTAVPAKPVDTASTATLYVLPGTSPVTATPMAASSVGTTGGNESHGNMMPSLAVSFIIALVGIFPSRN
jgi:microcystin-dependent protein